MKLKLQEWIIIVMIVCGGIVYLTLMPSKSVDDEEPEKSVKTDPNFYVGRYWSKIDSEIDWCELNHTLSKYIAEPVNTLTGVSYMILAMFLFAHYYKLYYQINKTNHNSNNNVSFSSSFENTITFEFLVLIFELFVIGIGTVLFHATLKYSMQVFDELSIYYCFTTLAIAVHSLNGYFAFFNNNNNRNKKQSKEFSNNIKLYERKMWNVTIAAFIWDILVTVGLLYTNPLKSDQIIGISNGSINDNNNNNDTLLYNKTAHNVLRAIMTITFVMLALVVIYTGVKILNIVENTDLTKLQNKNKIEPVKQILERSVNSGIRWFMAAFSVWVIDNCFCDVLQDLPLNVPYLHFHALWHMFSCVLLHYILFCFLLYRIFIIMIVNDLKSNTDVNGLELKKHDSIACKYWLYMLPVVTRESPSEKQS